MGWLSSLWQRPRGGDDESLDALRQRGFIAIDLETTGLDSRRDGVVALAAVRFVADVCIVELATLVNPGRSIPASATRIHGIDDALVAGAPDEASAVARLDAVCAEEVVVGHGVAFDCAVVARVRGSPSASRPARAVLCTQRLAAALYPGWPDCSLEAVCDGLGVGLERRHTADGDALTAGRLFIAMLPRLRQRGIRTLTEALWLQESTGFRAP